MPESLPGAPVERSASIAQQRHPVAVNHAPRILAKVAVCVAIFIASHYWLGPTMLVLAGLWLLLAVAGELRRLIRPKQPPTSGQRAGRAAASYFIASRLARKISR